MLQGLFMPNINVLLSATNTSEDMTQAVKVEFCAQVLLKVCLRLKGNLQLGQSLNYWVKHRNALVVLIGNSTCLDRMASVLVWFDWPQHLFGLIGCSTSLVWLAAVLVCFDWLQSLLVFKQWVWLSVHNDCWFSNDWFDWLPCLLLFLTDYGFDWLQYLFGLVGCSACCFKQLVWFAAKLVCYLIGCGILNAWFDWLSRLFFFQIMGLIGSSACRFSNHWFVWLQRLKIF